MQVRVDWVLRIFGTQVNKEKTAGSARVSYDYDLTDTNQYLADT